MVEPAYPRQVAEPGGMLLEILGARDGGTIALRTGQLLRVTTAELGPTIRIISARRATVRERHAYEREA